MNRLLSARPWPRRQWLTSQAHLIAALAVGTPRWRTTPGGSATTGRCGPEARAARTATQAERLDLTPWQTLAQHAVDAARAAGAHYADARLTRVVLHAYGLSMGDGDRSGDLSSTLREDDESIGVGVRVLVDGYWGFAASAVLTADEVAFLAQDAVGQARENAKGPPWSVDLGRYPVATGTWTTPVRIDPFTIPIEEKLAYIYEWNQSAGRAGVSIDYQKSWIHFVRQERVVATSEGALFTQTLYESGGVIVGYYSDSIVAKVRGIEVAGAGWERLLDAKIPEQMPQLKQELDAKLALRKTARPTPIGRYTLVCDGAAMAAVTGVTLGIATQLDRALGYEANARGTSFLDDPLGMVGNTQVAAPLVTLTANRSAPKELATAKWDDEGVEPEPFTVIKDGVLHDFQTTREQAAWLAAYYQRQGRPVRSHGCAAAEDAQNITLQMMPNLSLEPSTAAVHLEDLIADVADGILIEGGDALSDFQARTGLLGPASMRQIKNGRLGVEFLAGGVFFNSQDLWRQVKAIGGSSTQMTVNLSQYQAKWAFLGEDDPRLVKGQPAQSTGYSTRAVAATIMNQPIINPARRA